MITVHPFYREHNLRVIEIPVGVKCPVVKDWPNTQKRADDIQPLLDGRKCNKYGWLLDPCHVVIDIDCHDGGANGYDSLATLEADLGYTLWSVCGAFVNTPSGGRHYYFTKPENVTFGKVFKDKYPGIDFINGSGKQVIAANSFHDLHEGTYELHGNSFMPVPVSLVKHLQAQRPETKQAPFVSAERAGDEFNQSDRGLALICGELYARGYGVRNVGDYYEWDRPNKTTSSKFSGYVGKRSKSGNYQLTCFTLSDPVFPSGESMSIFHAYTMLCWGGDHAAAASALHDRGFAVSQSDGVDLSFYLGQSRGPDDDGDDECFAAGMVPATGLIRDIFDSYWEGVYRRCSVMGLATAIVTCQTLFGRKIQSWTGLAPNDYHLVLAPTTSGKEGPLGFVSRLMAEAGADQSLMPEKIQSGNGLLTAMTRNPCGLWMCDEFGFVLKSILDKKNKDTNAKAICQYLLSFYGKSSTRFNGSAYSAGLQHSIEQPHLCVFGVSTGHTVFSEVDENQVMDGLLGRISFWRVHERPEKNRQPKQFLNENLIELVSAWHNWHPGGNMATINPQPIRLAPQPDARKRWEDHEDLIDSRMTAERAIRSALWGRTAARSMKLALIHRMARITHPSEINEFNEPEIEIEDINWGIKISNWCANLACDLVRETVADTIGDRVAMKILEILTGLGGSATMSQISGKMKRSDASQIRAAIAELETAGKVSTTIQATAGRAAKVIKMMA